MPSMAPQAKKSKLEKPEKTIYCPISRKPIKMKDFTEVKWTFVRDPDEKKEAKIRKRKARKARMKLEGGGEAIQTLASRKLGDPQVEVVHYTDYRRLKPGGRRRGDP